MCRTIVLWVLVFINYNLAFANDRSRYDYVVITLCGKPVVFFAADKKKRLYVIGKVDEIVKYKQYTELVLNAMQNSKPWKMIRANSEKDYLCDQKI